MPAKSTKATAAALKAARDPATPASELETLYQNALRRYDYAQRKWVNETPEVMAALAQNPNLPPYFLRILLSSYPEAFCLNPIVPFLPLELPTFWSDAREDGILNLLRFADVPVSVVQTLAAGASNKPVVQKAARLHIGFAGELDPARWQNAVREACRNEAAPKNETFAQLFADWVEVGLLPAPWWKENDLPEPVPLYEPHLDELRPSLAKAREKLAALPADADPDYLHSLLAGRALIDSALTIAVALHPNTSAETLRHLGQRREHNLGMVVVLHPTTPPDTLRHFAEGPYEGERVRRIAAVRHKNADADVLRVLAADSDPVVRRLARRHKNAPDDLLAIRRQTALTVGKTSPDTKNDAQLWYIFHALYAKPTLGWITKGTASEQWMKRLAAALALARRAANKAATLKVRKGIKRSAEEQILLQTLQNDGNRLVRAVAHAPVSPVFDFTL